MLIRIATALLISCVLVACGEPSQTESEPESSTPTSSQTTTSPTEPALVGKWWRVTTCEERVQALRKAGLGKFAAEHAAGEGWIPGVTSREQLKDPKHPCQGAVPLAHSHYFTNDGLFGSRDDENNQVDDGTYRLSNDRTVVITKEFGEVTFHFKIRGATLTLEPIIPACVKSGCFGAQWAIAMAYPDLPWTRAT